MFLKPVINFFGKLKFKQKILVMIIAVIIPFLVPSYFTYGSFYQELKIIKNEQKALKFIYPLKELILLIQQHRGMMEAFISGVRDFGKKIKENEKKVEKYLSDIERLEKEAKIGILKDIKKLWKSVKMKNMSRDGYHFLLHTKIIEKLIEAKKEIANNYGIFRDKNMKNHYLIVSVFEILPNIIEYTGIIRGYTSAILSKKEIGDKDEENIYNAIITLKAEIYSLSLPISNYIKTAEDTKTLKSEFVLVNKELNDYIEKIQDILHKREKIGPKRFFDYATDVIKNVDNFYDILLKRFEKDLNLRKKEEFKKIMLLTFGLFLVTLVVFYLFLGFFYSIFTPLKKIEETIKKISKGDLSVSVKVDTDDEMKEIAQILNKMTNELKKHINYLEGYKIALDCSTLVTKGDIQGNIIYANDNFLNKTGFKKEELIGKPHSVLRVSDMPKNVFKEMWKTILNKKVWQGFLKIKTKKGGTLYTQTTIVPILDEDNNIKEFIAVRVDITELIKAQEKIKKMLYYDNLTNLPKRIKLIEDLKKKRYNNIIIINIDDFRQLNDVYGYEAGNFVLKECAKILSKEVDKKGKVYRLPSDEFAIVYSENLSKDRLLEYTKKVVELLESRVFKYKNFDIKILVKAGIAFIEDGSEDIEKIILDADSAVKEAKRKNIKIVYYKESESAKAEYRRKLEWIGKIKKAIEEDRFEPYFQPIYNNKTKKVEKYEALVRMVDEDGKVISPFFFLDISKQAKLYTKITKIMVIKTFEVFKNRKEQISLNLSTQDILDEEISAFILEKIKEFGMQKRVLFEESKIENVVIEITESEEVENYEVVEKFLKKVKAAGAEAAIDDFGSGYSNFVYILNMGIGYLKIDGSLIKNILTDEKSKTLVKAIVDFSEELGIKTVAEFVENKDIQEELEKIGVDFSQGYFIGAPIPKEKLPQAQ